MPKRNNAQSETTEKLTAADRPDKNSAAVALGKLGGLQGGKARANALTPERRIEIAQKAAVARWKKNPNNPQD